ncbi:mediator of RNA polymerase II transcription subunit 34 [Dorcoceras hygrometricum]|uniref:Mediator of RNA polymerase II transcription subunit 34 n=1 Tax=Dorcoceras hygrometricum TaxID=472368 RepID=A0A2Z7A4E2_9LAMI|nr:mediator of RNA polymerase II transcription subunit 34 [Dorcoceras hygrometricum]
MSYVSPSSTSEARDWYIILRLDAYQQLVVQTLVVKFLRLDYPTTARRQNAVVSINPNDIVLLSLTSSINWLHCSSLLIADVTADFIFVDPALALLFTTADCDDITANVIIADSRSCASFQLLILDFFQLAMLASSLLLAASSSRHADFIIAESRFLFASNPTADFFFLCATDSRLLLFIFFFEPFSIL